ncbi:hypothetical protein SAMD00019534_086170, partial [Acytostelium subglobosum LB1]|uniref:hypothetical protein n=1 Tax=Acytostelium subglobosum LB1 TaxID=1410327 RepID=UPI0006448A7C
LKMQTEGEQEMDKQVEQWKVRKLIKNLEEARGVGTSMISLVIRPGDQISRVNKMLAEENGTAAHIKSRVNRISVQNAISAAQSKLKLYNNVPANGLVIYCGQITTDDGKDKRVNIDIEPFKPINTSLYLCDNKFHTAALGELLESDEKYGFIIVDGNGALFGVLCGNTRTVLHKITVDLPKKHGRGGQSALRFSRLRVEKRHNYVRKVAELAAQLYIANDKVTVNGLVLAGSADFKNDLNNSDIFDPRLRERVLKVVDISYGGDNGFNQAIELSAEFLSNVKFVQEKKLVVSFFDEIAKDTGKVCFGVADTIRALDMGAIQTLIVWENLEVTRYEIKLPSEEKSKVLYLNRQQERDQSFMKDAATGVEYELIEAMPLVEWFANHYRKFGAHLELVSNRSEVGAQFCNGFGGIGGILRYRLDMATLNDYDNISAADHDDDDYDSDFDSSDSD